MSGRARWRRWSASAGCWRRARDAPAPREALEAWDWRYWAEKVRQQRYALDDAEIKPYFPLPRMVQAAFDCAHRLFGLRFTPREDLPVYHPDVKAYEVRDCRRRVVAIFLQDNFARAAKRSGAWMSTLRWQQPQRPGGGAAPVVLNNNNFAKGAPGAPTLLSLEDARTLFHEFGHGLHGMLSDVTYERLSGTQVLRDFVELPSQLFEHWIDRAGGAEAARAPLADRRADPRRADRAHACRAALQPGLRDGALLRQHLADMAVHAAARADPTTWRLGAARARRARRAGRAWA